MVDRFSFMLRNKDRLLLGAVVAAPAAPVDDTRLELQRVLYLL